VKRLPVSGTRKDDRGISRSGLLSALPDFALAGVFLIT